MELLGWDQGLTLLAPLVAVGVALGTRRVVPALALGVAVAAVVAHEGRLIGAGGLGAVAPCLVDPACGVPPGAAGDVQGWRGALGGVAAYLGDVLLDVDNATIVTFTLLVAAMVGVMGASGAMGDLVAAVAQRARGPRGAMVSSWLAGLVVFFDDYANCLVVGSAMRPLCDRSGVSRAKLAYIVDSTAAPIASLAVVGTWVGYEVGLLETALAGTGIGGFQAFLAALPYAFYGIFALGLVGLVAWSGLDLGPMLHEERAARAARAADPPPGPAPSAGAVARAALPVVALVGVTFGSVVVDGLAALDAPLSQVAPFELLGGADPFAAMLRGAAVGWALASALALGARRVTPAAWVRASGGGGRSVLQALGVLYLAWMLSTAIQDSGAREFLLTALHGRFPPALLPVATFGLASAVAFATGTSFGTMGILVPLAVPLAAELAGAGHVLYATVAAVLAGACLGDHASPISDTSVLSAVGAGCDLVLHVRTQLPYALLAGAVAGVLGFLPAGLGVSPWVCLPVGMGALGGLLWSLGRRPEDPVSAPEVRVA